MGKFCGALERGGYKGCARAEMEHPTTSYAGRKSLGPEIVRGIVRGKRKGVQPKLQVRKSCTANQYAALDAKVFN